MTNHLYDRLWRINTALNRIEDGWPCQVPTDTDTKPLILTAHPRVAMKYVESIRKEAKRLEAGLPGWEVSVDVFVLSGKEACCYIKVFFNGSAGCRNGCIVYNRDLNVASKSFVPSLRACVEQWPGEVDRLLNKFSKFPSETFKTKRYAALCELRRVLNMKWNTTMKPLTPYPYGEHAAR